MVYEITAYKCDYCGKIYQSKPGATGHEKKCFWNPEKRACASCDYNSSITRKCSALDKDLSVKGSLTSNCDFWTPDPRGGENEIEGLGPHPRGERGIPCRRN